MKKQIGGMLILLAGVTLAGLVGCDTAQFVDSLRGLGITINFDSNTPDGRIGGDTSSDNLNRSGDQDGPGDHDFNPFGNANHHDDGSGFDDHGPGDWDDSLNGNG